MKKLGLVGMVLFLLFFGFVCEVLAQNYVQSELLSLAMKHGGQNICKKIRAKWDDFRLWLDSPVDVPQKYVKRLTKMFGLSAEELFYQDWAKAEEHAKKVADIRKDLSWPFAVLGQSAERRGDFESAGQYYLSGVHALGTTQDFTATWMEILGCPDKYCAERLLKLAEQYHLSIPEEPYVTAATSRDTCGIFEYWMKEAETAENDGDYGKAYKCWYRAGWDDYCVDNMDVILDGLVRTSKEAGYGALHRLAEHHHKAFSSRP